MTFLRIWTVKRKKKNLFDAYIFPSTVTYQLKICNISIPILPLCLWKSGSKYFLWQKKLGGGGQFSYLAQHLRKICDYLCILMSNIYLISLRDGITGPLIKLRWFQEDLETSPDYILDLLKPLSGLRTMLTKIKTFSSNPRKALISDWLNKCVQRSLIWQNCIQPLHWV